MGSKTLHDRFKQLRDYLGQRYYVLVPTSKTGHTLKPTDYHFKKPYQWTLIGVYKDVDDKILQYMFNLGWEFVDYTIEPFTKKHLAVILKEKIVTKEKRRG